MKRQWKGFVCGALVTILVLGLIGTAAATVGKRSVELDYNDIKVTMDGKPVSLVDTNGNAVEPFALNGTTYLPIRAISSTLGLSVGWDSATSTVTLFTPEERKATYITRTGSKYHNDSSCNGGTYWEVPFSAATGMGYTPCEKCVH